MSAAKQQQYLSSGADSPTVRETDIAKQQAWHLHHGFVQLFIVGNGEDAWMPCSAPDYSRGACRGTPEEIDIANRALDILRRDHACFYGSAVPAIKAALKAATQAHNLANA